MPLNLNLRTNETRNNGFFSCPNLALMQLMLLDFIYSAGQLSFPPPV